MITWNDVLRFPRSVGRFVLLATVVSLYMATYMITVLAARKEWHADDRVD